MKRINIPLIIYGFILGSITTISLLLGAPWYVNLINGLIIGISIGFCVRYDIKKINNNEKN